MKMTMLRSHNQQTLNPRRKTINLMNKNPKRRKMKIKKRRRRRRRRMKMTVISLTRI
jgi:hypothetical protein